MPDEMRTDELAAHPQLFDILVSHAYLGVRVQFLLRGVLLAFMLGTIVFEPPAHDRTASYLIVICYAVWAVGLGLWTRRGGITPVRWMWVALVVDALALGTLTLVAGASAQQSWTADILVNGLFLIPMLAASQLRPGVCAAVVAPTVLVYFIANIATKSANSEPLSSVLLRTFVLAGLGAGCVALSYVQRSRVLTIARLAADRAELLTDLLTVESRERAKLAEQLHDGALQYVLAARQDLEDARDGGGLDAFNRVDYALDRSSGLLRSVVSELHPAVLREAGLKRALQELVSRESNRTQVVMSLNTDGWTDSRSASDDLLFTAARELLANVVKHAQASSVRVVLDERDGVARLLVADDGRGIVDGSLTTRLAEGHVGLASLRARAAGAGGRMHVAGNAPSGTIVTLSVPRGT
jgi:two-component system NarL family sensor kinase